MQQFIVQVVLFSVIGAAVWGLSRLLRCRPVDVAIAHPKKSALQALLAVAVSSLIIGLLILRQHLLHGPTGAAGPDIREAADLVPQLVLTIAYVLPAGLFMLKARERPRTAGFTTANLWQSLVIGMGLALLTFYFRPGGIAAKLGCIEPHHAVAFVFYGFVGFGEEFLFRGYLQNRLIRWLGRWRGWVLASVIMAVVHFPHRLMIEGLAVGDAAAASLALVPVSLLMGFVMLRTQNVVASGIFHTFANWVNVLG